MTRNLNQYVHWPCAADRIKVQKAIQRQHGLLQCVGFVDGTHIGLAQAPSRSKRSSNSYHSYKKKYGFNVMAVVNQNKRFTFAHWGYSAAASDIRVQQASRLHTDAETYFNDGEYVLGDSGFLYTSHFIPMYRKMAGQAELNGKKVGPHQRSVLTRVFRRISIIKLQPLMYRLNTPSGSSRDAGRSSATRG